MKISPKDTFEPRVCQTLTSEDFSVVLNLYQPLMSPCCFSLYILLNDWQKDATKRYFLVNELEVALGCGLNDLYEARRKLEALGLLRVFVTHQNNVTQFIYEVQKPLTPQAFFREDLLRMLLLQFVGEHEYQRLQDKFLKKDLIGVQYQEITCSLLDVFTFTPQQLSNVAAAPKVTNTNSVKEWTLPQVLDKPLLKELLENSFLRDEDVLQHLELLNVLKNLYAIDESQLIHMLEESLKIEQDEIDWQLFEAKINQRFEFVSSKQQSVQTPSVSEITDQKVDKDKTEEKKTLEACQYYQPGYFLTSLKQNNVTSAEQKLLKEALAKLPSEVINVIFYYIIVEKENAFVNKNYFWSIAEGMQKAQIKTAQQAIEYLTKMFDGESQPEVKSKVNYRNKRQKPIVKEVLPDWAKEDKPTKTKKVQTVDTVELQSWLNEFKTEN